eukprot:1193297-Prorocentrum_minimum.AAC.1
MGHYSRTILNLIPQVISQSRPPSRSHRSRVSNSVKRCHKHAPKTLKRYASASSRLAFSRGLARSLLLGRDFCIEE